MNKLMLNICAGSVMAGGWLSSLPVMAAQTDPVAVAAAGKSDAKYLEYPVYEGDDLGVTVKDNVASFRLWAPTAQAVDLLLYDQDAWSKPIDVIHMKRAEQGTWTATRENPYGLFYTFRVNIDGRWLDETPGIYANAAGVNGKRAAVIDFAATNPSGWENDRGPETAAINDAVIYEMHHRDFSIHPSSGIANKGKFLALKEKGTRNATGETTGIDHLKELGVTHVHILPSYDYNSVDEANLPANQYNWGYDPWNYNVPEGSYSTNPSDPEARVREFKEMVKALHEAGIGVVMDVVYNHTANNDDSNFSLTVPGYFYRHNEDGSYSDGSGCGNETASEREMMRRYIVNSLKHWMEEYHVDGFRFDLMGLHDIETMNDVAREVHKINPNAIIYGEGWSAGGTPLPDDARALKVNVAKMDGVAVFSDDIRDGVKGHYSDASRRGFATGAPGLAETVKIGIVGSTAHPQVDYSKGSNAREAYATTPSQVINYVSCHDDLNLTDKLAASMPGSTEADRQRAARLAQTIVFTSQGTPFMYEGEEMFRSKHGVHNTYKSPDSINAIDWSLKHRNIDQYNYYRELIALRKAHPAFRMTSAEDVARHIRFDDVRNTYVASKGTKKSELDSLTSNLVSYSLIDHANGDTAREIKVIFNGSDKAATMRIPKGDWTVIASDGRLSHKGLTDIEGNPITFGGGNTTVEPCSALILIR